MPAPRTWSTAAQAAAALNVHHSTVAAWIARGFLKAARQPGPRGRYRVPAGEVERMRRSLGLDPAPRAAKRAG